MSAFSAACFSATASKTFQQNRADLIVGHARDQIVDLFGRQIFGDQPEA